MRRSPRDYDAYDWIAVLSAIGTPLLLLLIYLEKL